MERGVKYEVKNLEVQKVVRSLIVSLAFPEELYADLASSQPAAVLRFYLGLKNSGKKERLAFFGGRVKSWENLPEAIQREIGEEVAFDFLGLPKQTIFGPWQYSSPRSGKREVMLTYNPVLPNKGSMVGDSEIAQVKILRFEELKRLIEFGTLGNVPLENHLAMSSCSKDKIQINNEEAQKRNYAMKRMLQWMGHMEDFYHRKFRQIIFQEGKIISKEIFIQEYNKILNNFICRGFETAIKKFYCLEQKNQNQDKLIENLRGGYLGKDILYYLPFLTNQEGITLSLLEQSTDGVKMFVSFLQGILTDFLQEQSLTPKQYRDFMVDSSTALSYKLNQLNLLNYSFSERLKKIFNLDDSGLDEVMDYVRNFFRDLSSEMKIADPKLTKGLYQDFTLLNEINNANFGYLLNLFFGVDIKENMPQFQTLIQFEAGRQLLLILKALSGVEYYKKEINKIRNGKMQSALSNFFGPVVDEQIINLNKNNKMRIRIRKRGENLYLVDERPTKTFTSFLRKSFEEKVEDIKDFFSVSVVILNQDKNLDRANFLIDEFYQFLLEQFPGAKLSCFDKKNYGINDYLLASRTNNNLPVEGKRQGSQSNRLLRTKLFFELDGERLEFVVYPFYSTANDNKLFWGWLEKIKDDKEYVVRRLLAEHNGIPSFYNLLFPPNLYPQHYRHKLNSHYYS